jgi:tetratricopeptide (TPR) repeat protein
VGELIFAIPERTQASDSQLSDISRFLDLAPSLEAVLGADIRLSFITAMALGKAGRLPEAIDLSRRLYSQAPSWDTASMVANALRRLGDIDGALDFFAAAARLDPRDVTALLEIRDMHLEAGNFGDALAAYEAALARETRQPWAHPSALFCRYRLTADRKWLRRLRSVAHRPLDECGVGPALERLLKGYSSDDARWRAESLLRRIESPPRQSAR